MSDERYIEKQCNIEDLTAAFYRYGEPTISGTMLSVLINESELLALLEMIPMAENLLGGSRNLSELERRILQQLKLT